MRLKTQDLCGAAALALSSAKLALFDFSSLLMPYLGFVFGRETNRCNQKRHKDFENMPARHLHFQLNDMTGRTWLAQVSYPSDSHVLITQAHVLKLHLNDLQGNRFRTLANQEDMR